MSDYDAETFDSVLGENLHAAAAAGLSDETVAQILLEHRDGIEQHGLETHAGYGTTRTRNETDETDESDRSDN